MYDFSPVIYAAWLQAMRKLVPAVLGPSEAEVLPSKIDRETLG